MSKLKTAFTVRQRTVLDLIGLSRDAIDLYGLLLDSRTLSAAEAAAELGTFASAVYRLFYRLEELGLVRQLGGRPRRFQAVPKKHGLPAAVRTHHRQLQVLLGEQEATRLTTTYGRMPVRSTWNAQIGEAQQQIQLWLTDISVAHEWYAELQAAIARGAKVKLLVRVVAPRDRVRAIQLQRLGIYLRQSVIQAEPLLITDGQNIAVAFGDPHDTEQAVGLTVQSPDAMLVFASRFNAAWHRARQLLL